MRKVVTPSMIDAYNEPWCDDTPLRLTVVLIHTRLAVLGVTLHVGVELQLVVVDHASQVLPQNALARARQHLDVDQVLQPLLRRLRVDHADVPNRHAALVKEHAQLGRARWRVLHRLQLRAHITHNALQFRTQLLSAVSEVLVRDLVAHATRLVFGRQHQRIFSQQVLARHDIIAVIDSFPHLVPCRGVQTGHAMCELRGGRGLVVDVRLASNGQRGHHAEAEAADVDQEVRGDAETSLLLPRVRQDVVELRELARGGLDASTRESEEKESLVVALVDDGHGDVLVDAVHRVEGL